MAAPDPVVARFWAGVLGWDLLEQVSDDAVRVGPRDRRGFRLDDVHENASRWRPSSTT